MNTHPNVIKIGGNDLEREGFIAQLAQTIAGLNGDGRCIVVHGGGRSIDALMDKLGLQPTYVNGQRVTDEAVLHAAEMVLSGAVNKALAAALVEAGAARRCPSGAGPGRAPG